MVDGRSWGRMGAHGWRAFLILALLLGTLGWVSPSGVRAEPVPSEPCLVTSAADSGAGTLRDLLAEPACTPIGFDLVAMGSGTITLTTGELLVTRDVEIIGPGAAALTISGNGASRVFRTGADTTVSISGVTISGGYVNSGSGGGILNEGTLTLDTVVVSGNRASSAGGGINHFSGGTLTLIRSSVSGNKATRGGGIDNSGTGGILYVIQSAITGNSATPAPLTASQVVAMAPVSYDGGGLHNANDSDAYIVNSTISGNSAASYGGGIANDAMQATVAIQIYLSTITANSALLGGGLSSDGDTAYTPTTIAGSIVAGNTANGDPNARGVLKSYGYNVVQQGIATFTPESSDREVTDAGLEPLALNAPGTTPTHALKVDSPAIDTISSSTCVVGLLALNLDLQIADQRGVTRPQGAACDSGAFELDAVTPTITSLSPASVPAGSPATVVTITGSDFLPDGRTTVTVDGTSYAVTYISGTQISITLPESALLTVGARQIVVANAAPTGGTAQATFMVTTPSPTGFVLTITTDGAGTVAQTPAPDVLATRYSAGTEVSLAPQGNGTSRFVGWRVDGTFQGWSEPLNLTMEADHTVQAIFRDQTTFSDVPAGSFGGTAITELTRRDIIKGYGDGTFGPNDLVLRAQAAALVGRAMGSDGPSGPGIGPNTWATEDHGNPFSDRSGVDEELWRVIGSLAFRDVARGYGDGTYDPLGTVSHAQAISLIARAMVAKGYWSAQPDDPTIYTAIPAGSGHRIDVSTFVFYAGALPLTMTTDRFDGPGGWDQPASRAWVAEALWAALSTYHPVDRVP